jgi:hypothetical protein
MKRKRMYRVVTHGWIVEGRATSPQNACRLAFRKLMQAELMAKQPATDRDSPSTFKNTTVEIIEDEEGS